MLSGFGNLVTIMMKQYWTLLSLLILPAEITEIATSQ